METVAHSPVDDELHLLTEWGSPADRARTSKAGILSIALHVAAILTLVLLPDSFFQIHTKPRVVRHITPLVMPLFEPTQTAPNRTKLSKEFNAEASQARPRVQTPPAPPSTMRPAARREIPLPPVAAERPVPTPAPPLPEPPKVDASVKEPPKLGPGPQIAQVTPPQIQPQETRPRSPFESPSAQVPVQGGIGRVPPPPPSTSVAEAIRGAVRGGSGGVVVGDSGGGIGGIGEGINLPPSPGHLGSSLELLSDPQGVDFKPYLVKILAAVRRNWWAVMPEAARLGRRGRVGIQFSIGRNGTVLKLVIAQASGTDALDRAAVVGVSASNPFPPLPSEFKGDQIRLQFNFAYNAK
jgi:TonB family protein